MPGGLGGSFRSDVLLCLECHISLLVQLNRIVDQPAISDANPSRVFEPFDRLLWQILDLTALQQSRIAMNRSLQLGRKSRDLQVDSRPV